MYIFYFVSFPDIADNFLSADGGISRRNPEYTNFLQTCKVLDRSLIRIEYNLLQTPQM